MPDTIPQLTDGQKVEFLQNEVNTLAVILLRTAGALAMPVVDNPLPGERSWKLADLPEWAALVLRGQISANT